MTRDFCALARRYGGEAVLIDGEKATAGMAFVQPLGDRGEKLLPTPLGRRERGRMLCLSEPALGLESAGEEAVLAWGGKKWRVITAHPVRVGEEIVFVWAVLLPADEEGTA